MAQEVSDALVAAIEAAFNSRDVDRILEYFDDEGVFATARGPLKQGTELRGKAEIGRFLRERFSYIPDMYWHPQYRFVSACGQYGVSYWVVTGTDQRNGSHFELNGCDIFRFREGKLIHKDTFWKAIE